MTLPPDLVPVMLPDSNRSVLMRTPVEVAVFAYKSGYTLYTVCVALETYRYFDHTNVPDEITSLLGMIHAFPEHERMVTSATWAARYVAPDPRLEHIGWQLSRDFYMLVLPLEFLKNIYITAKGKSYGSDT